MKYKESACSHPSCPSSCSHLCLCLHNTALKFYMQVLQMLISQQSLVIFETCMPGMVFFDSIGTDTRVHVPGMGLEVKI